MTSYRARVVYDIMIMIALGVLMVRFSFPRMNFGALVIENVQSDEPVNETRIVVVHRPYPMPNKSVITCPMARIDPEIRNLMLDLATTSAKSRLAKQAGLSPEVLHTLDEAMLMEDVAVDAAMRLRLAKHLNDSALIAEVQNITAVNGSFVNVDLRLKSHVKLKKMTKAKLYEQLKREFEKNGWAIWQQEPEVNQQMRFLLGNIGAAEERIRKASDGKHVDRSLLDDLEEAKGHFVQYAMEIKFRAKEFRGRRDL
jgi:hypothetical protein